MTLPRKLRELRADPRRAGWVLVRQSGSHQTWQHSDLPAISVRLSGNDGDDAKPYQNRDVARAFEAVTEEDEE
ncbi:MAG: type II toxin-antitoxin system HicA family toxin [Thermomicrobiales bacterium]